MAPLQYPPHVIALASLLLASLLNSRESVRPFPLEPTNRSSHDVAVMLLQKGQWEHKFHFQTQDLEGTSLSPFSYLNTPFLTSTQKHVIFFLISSCMLPKPLKALRTSLHRRRLKHPLRLLIQHRTLLTFPPNTPKKRPSRCLLLSSSRGSRFFSASDRTRILRAREVQYLVETRAFSLRLKRKRLRRAQKAVVKPF